MAVPDFQTLMLPLLKLASDGQQHTASDGQQHTMPESIERLAKEFQLSQDDQAQLLQSGQSRLYNRIGWARTYLKKAGLLQSVALGRFQLTNRGREVLASRPTAINLAFLKSRFPEMLAFRKARSKGQVADEEPSFKGTDGTWNQRAGVEERVRTAMEKLLPNEAIRRAAMDFLASAVDAADEERASAWCMRETQRGLRMMTGRLLACELGRSQIKVSVIGPVSEDIRRALAADAKKDEEYKFIPGWLLLTFPIERAPEALDLLRDGFDSGSRLGPSYSGTHPTTEMRVLSEKNGRPSGRRP
jgi:Mrr N-terminal domain